MATTKPSRKVASQTTTATPAAKRDPGRATASAAAGGPEAPEVPRGSRTGAQAGQPDSARLVCEVRDGLGVTREVFARLTGFSVRAITGWEAGRPVSEPGLRRVKEMDRLRGALAEGMRDEFIARWLVSPCEGLGGLKPVEVLERGEVDRLWRVVLLIGSGMPT